MKTIRVFRLVSIPLLAAGLMLAQEAPPPDEGQAQAQPFAPEQLDTLVAPVALYPDALLSQILVAATYPLEITEAAQWLQQNRNLQGAQLVDAARQQNWDPSVQALVVFPDVIGRLAADIRWTTDLGNAFLAQQADVMNSVQQLRSQAWQAGKLRSNAQETVTSQMQGDQSAIEIQPANPEVVYVPSYNPEYIWGPPAYGYYPAWDYPGYGVGFGFGRGIYIGGFFGGLGWGGWGWGPNWFGHSVYQNRFFFDHYGYGGRGFRGGVWAHDAGHRHGVPYAGAGRFGSGQAGGWNRFGQGAPRGNAYRASPSNGGNRVAPSYRSAPSYGGNRGNAYGASPSNGGNRVAPNYRSSPSYGNGGGNRVAPSYRSNPSYGNGGGNRAAPSYRSNPSYGNGGGNRAAPSYRSSPHSEGGGSRGYSGGSSHAGGSARGGGGGGNRGGGGGSHAGHDR
jgi:hypothetical protein